MKKIYFVAAIAITILLSFSEITEVIASTVGCGTTAYQNTNARIKSTKTEECGECTWNEINASWQPGDGAAAKYIRRTAKANASVQSCEAGDSGETCTSVLMNGTVTCPDSAGGSGGGSE